MTIRHAPLAFRVRKLRHKHSTRPPPLVKKSFNMEVNGLKITQGSPRSRKPTTMTTLARLWSLAMLSVVLLPMSLGCGLGPSNRNQILFLSFSGFRWDYVDKLPKDSFFRVMRENGSSAGYMQPIFPTETVPNLYSIATGLYAESHGIVGTFMYDPAREAYFDHDSKQSFWWGGEPIWVTAQRQKRTAAVLFWPGSNAQIKGVLPSTYFTLSNERPARDRIGIAGGMICGHNDLNMVSFKLPAATAYKQGPASPDVFEQIRFLGYIVDEMLYGIPVEVLAKLNIIVTSDHGMTSVDPRTQMLHLYDYVNIDYVDKEIPHEAYVSILPKKGMIAEVYKAAKKIPHVTVYQKETIPEEFHYKNNPRVLPILILPDEGWMLVTPQNKLDKTVRKGAHGYSNALPSMRTIFYAKGPDFLPGVKIPMIRSVDIYPLLCHLLDIKPAPNNGSLTSIAALLKKRSIKVLGSKNGAERLAVLSSFSWMCLGLMALGLISYK